MTMAEREKELAECIIHILKNNVDWSRYHLNRATQGMPEGVADQLHDALEEWATRRGSE